MHKLAKYMTTEGLTQQEMATMIGVNQSTVNRLLRKGFTPSVILAVAIEKATKGKVRCEDWSQ